MKRDVIRPTILISAILLAAAISLTAASSKKKPVGCDMFDNCTNCFCDSLCWKFGDCCKSYVSSLETSGDLESRLPLNNFTCQDFIANDDIEDFSGSIYVINGCPDSFKGAHVRLECERGSGSVSSSEDWFYQILVTSRTTGLVYQNFFCALCHRERDVMFWTMSTKLKNNQPGELATDGIQLHGNSLSNLLSDEKLSQQFSASYRPPAGTNPRRCVDARQECLPEYETSKESALCKQENSTLYVYTPEFGIAYRNKYCAVCNGIDLSVLVCNQTRINNGTRSSGIELHGLAPFSVILDLNTGHGLVSGESDKQQLRSCPEHHVYDPFSATCRLVKCPPGQFFDDEGVCRTFLRSLTFSQGSEISDEENNSTLECPHGTIDFNASEYRMLDNGSVFITPHQTVYDIGQFQIRFIGSDDDSSVNPLYICNPFSDSTETLLLDKIGIYLSLVCSVISLIGLGLQFAVYMFFSVLRNRPGQLVLCLVVSLFMGQLLFLLVSQSSGVLCYAQAVVMHYSFLAAFFWMNVMAVDVYRTFGSSAISSMLASSSSGSKRFMVYSLFAWGGAGVFVVIGILMDQLEIGNSYRPLYGRNYCWFNSSHGLLVLFAAPLAIVLIVNIGLFFGSIVQIQRASKATRVAVQKPANFSLLMIYAKLSVVMGLGWMIGFVAMFANSTVLWYIFIVLNSLQGAFICLAFIMTRQVLRLIREQCCHRLLPTSASESATGTTSMRSPVNTNTKLTSF